MDQSSHGVALGLVRPGLEVFKTDLRVAISGKGILAGPICLGLVKVRDANNFIE